MAATSLPFAGAEPFLEAFAENVGGLISFVDSQERMLFCSQALADWFESTRTQIQGKTLRELYGAPVYAEFEPWVKRALAGEPVHYERLAMHRSGKPIWISVNLRPDRKSTRLNS